jgi:hypothetical protein
VALCNSPNPQNATFNPATVANYFGQDLGQFALKTAPSGFTWATNMTTDFMKMGIPTVGGSAVPNSLVYYNSSHTAYQLSGSFGSLSVFFKQAQYRVKISIHASLLSAQTVCLPFSSPNPITQQSTQRSLTDPTVILLPSIKSGIEVFDWSDIIIGSPAWSSLINSLCLSLPMGTTNIDPLALDGSASNSCSNVSSCTVTLTTTSTPDVIIVQCNCFYSSSTFTISDGSTLSWTQRANQCYDPQNCTNGNPRAIEWCAIASGTLTGDVITISGNAGSYIGLIAFGVSGANTSGCSNGNSFDSGGSTFPVLDNLECTVTGYACVYNISTGNANDFLFHLEYSDTTITTTGGSCDASTCTQIKKVAFAGTTMSNQYLIVSSTQSGINLQDGTGQGGCANPTCTTAFIESFGDAIKQSASTVTQPIKITTLTAGAPSATVTISGCGTLTNSTFTANGNVKHYSGVTASATCSLTEPADGTNTRYRWNVSPHPTAATLITFVACASGTCSEYDNNTYYQLQQTYSMTPSNPTTWDGTYNEALNGSLFNTPVTLTTFHLISGMGAVSGSFFSDYNVLVSFKTSFFDVLAGSVWFGVPPTAFTQTTGGNVDNVNYRLQAGNSNGLILIAVIVLGFMLIAMIASRRKR